MAFHFRLLLQAVVAFTAIGLSIYAPDFTLNTRYLVLGLVILLVGMPHGAIDHIISEKLGDWRGDSSKKIWFYSWYIGLVAIYSLLWVFFPLFSFALFMVITWYHFGQADTERYTLVGWKKRLMHFTRGFTVVGLIAYGDVGYASGVIESITGFSLIQFTQQFIAADTLAYIIASVYPLAFLLLSAVGSFNAKEFVASLFDAISVSALFLFADPVWAFSIYFGLWHSYNHVRVMLQYLNENDTQLNFGWFYKESFIYSLLSYLGILFVYNLTNAFGQEEYLVSLLFAAISVLTLPHMLVVEKLYSVFHK